MEFHYPKICVVKSHQPIIFIDTYMWRQLLTQQKDVTRLLEQCCKAKVVSVAITNVLGGELTQRNLKNDINQICGNALVEVPIGRITANQIIHAFLCYLSDRKEVFLNWDLAISEVPVLKPVENGLMQAISNITSEMNLAGVSFSGRKEEMVAAIIEVERDIWKTNLRIYWEIIKEYNANNKIKIIEGRTYDRFFATDYLTELPAVMMLSYLFAYVLNERKLKPQDVIDIYTLCELIPYVTLYIMDQDQHNRIKMLQRHYPELFGRLDRMCCLSSYLRQSKLSPLDVLQSILEFAKMKINLLK